MEKIRHAVIINIKPYERKNIQDKAKHVKRMYGYKMTSIIESVTMEVLDMPEFIEFLEKHSKLKEKKIK